MEQTDLDKIKIHWEEQGQGGGGGMKRETERYVELHLAPALIQLAEDINVLLC